MVNNKELPKKKDTGDISIQRELFVKSHRDETDVGKVFCNN